MDRRDFITRSSAASLLACFPASLAGLERITAVGKLERRSLGRTGERLSIIGFGGIVVMNATSRQASDRVAEAIDHGVNYFDVAPSYGNAEDMLGPALEPYRKNLFLACKTT
jgi:diketogulonate reductase-like aldo/keto reductase